MLRRPSLAAAHRLLHRRAAKPPPLPPPPSPPKPPQKPVPFTVHGITWHDPYSWMSSLSDSVAMRHMDIHLQQEERYTESAMSSLGADRLVRKLQIEMAPRLASDLCSPPVKWGPWLYYRRVEEGKQYPVLCRRLASLHQEFLSHSDPSTGFDFISGRKIEQKLIDYNQEAERFGGYSYEELSELSPDHRFIAYTMYDKEKDTFTLLVRDLTSGELCDQPRVDSVANISWAMNGQALLYTVRNDNNRPYSIFCSLIESSKDDILILEEPSENIYVNIRNTKDFRFITVNIFSDTSSKVFLMNADNPMSGMKLIWESEALTDCIIEHNKGNLYLFTDASRGGVPSDSHYLLYSPVESAEPNNWKILFDEEPGVRLLDVDFSDSHMVLILKEGKKFRLCSVKLPLPTDVKGPTCLSDLCPCYLSLPEHVCQILPGQNYDFYSSTMRFTISSPVMPDAVVDYNIKNGTWVTVQQHNMLYERTKALYGNSSPSLTSQNITNNKNNSNNIDNNIWYDLSEYYACEFYDVCSAKGSQDGASVSVPLTVVYSRKHNNDNSNNNNRPCLLHGHGAYGELLDQRWRTELKSLLDRGWVIAFAHVRGGGGFGKTWHRDGTRTKKINSINDYISCAEFLISQGIVNKNKLAGWGYSAGSLLVASAINSRPNLFRAAVLKVPFLDVCSTLLQPILPLTPSDYEEFGFPNCLEDFLAIKNYSPYENIRKDTLYPAVMVTSSLNTRFGVWEAAKWIARVRELTIVDPRRPVVLNLTTDVVEESKYLQTKELALEIAFLLKTVTDPKE